MSKRSLSNQEEFMLWAIKDAAPTAIAICVFWTVLYLIMWLT